LQEVLPVKSYTIPVVALFAAGASAQAPAVVPLEVRPGLWSIERTAESLPIGLRGVAPEARQKLADEVRQFESPRLIRQQWERCLTAEQIREAFRPAEEAQCRYEVVRSDAKSLLVNLQCEADTQRPRRDGTFEVRAQSPEHLQAEIDLNLGEVGNAATLITRVTAKWIGAGCPAPAEAAQPAAK
jgi:hypothetical protein